ncbi:hypothetical protein [Scytonema sp. NUACC21]
MGSVIPYSPAISYNRLLVKREKSGSPGENATPCSVRFRRMSTLDTSPNAQSPKVGKMEKGEPAVSRHKSPNQRKYEEVRFI